jgi:DNA-binding response OmpR family regulator
MHVSDIQWNSEQHFIKAGHTLIPLTITEYRLLFPLRSGTPVTYADLAWMAYQYKCDSRVRTMMDKHIDRIRGKLRGTGVYVYCVLGYGYLLLPELTADNSCLVGMTSDSERGQKNYKDG